jgi:hypothetical protein
MTACGGMRGTELEAEEKLLWGQLRGHFEACKNELDAQKKQDLERQQHLAMWSGLQAQIDALDESRFRGDPELHAAFLEYRGAITENRKLRPLFEVRRCGGKTGKTKLGRPSMWRDSDGLFFVRAVNSIREVKRCSTVRAIRYVKERIWSEKLRGVSDAALQVRYQEASKYWALYLNPEECDAVIAQHAASSQRMSVAIKRHLAAWGRVKDFP